MVGQRLKGSFDFSSIIFTIIGMKHFIRLLPILLLCADAMHGQRLPVQTFTTKDGLASNLVTKIFQDSKGYLWIGTDEGISVFDGDKFKNIRFDNSKVFGYVNEIIESSFGTEVMWIATNGRGLIRSV